MRGCFVFLANCFNVPSPIPLVAPTKTATSPAGRLVGIRELEARINSRETMVAGLGISRRVYHTWVIGGCMPG